MKNYSSQTSDRYYFIAVSLLSLIIGGKYWLL
jgi:hypothetical protein